MRELRIVMGFEGMISLERSAVELSTPTEILRTVDENPSLDTSTERSASHPRASDARRGRESDRGGQSQPIRPSGRHHDPDRPPAWAAGGRGLRPSLGSGELRWRGASRPEGQERHPEHASLAWRRTASAAPASAREQAVTLCLRERTRVALHDRSLCSDGGARGKARPRP
jgi:hypothetical protein